MNNFLCLNYLNECRKALLTFNFLSDAYISIPFVRLAFIRKATIFIKSVIKLMLMVDSYNTVVN